MKWKTITASALALIALAGCTAAPVDQGPAEASVPTLTEAVEASESMADLLVPPSATTTLQPIQGLLPPTSEEGTPQFIWEQVELEEVEELPALPR